MSEIDSMISRLTERQSHEFAVACARRVQDLMRDPRSVSALDTRKRWLRGEATEEEMAAAWAAAAAAWAAATAATAAWDAADAADAAWAAADAALAAAAAAWAAADAADAARTAAWDAAWDAERAWQREELDRMLAEGGAAC